MSVANSPALFLPRLHCFHTTSVEVYGCNSAKIVVMEGILHNSMAFIDEVIAKSRNRGSSFPVCGRQAFVEVL